MQEGIIHFGGALFAFGGFSEAVKGTLPDSIPGKESGDLIPFLDVIGVVVELVASGAGAVGGVGFVLAVINSEFLKISEDAKGEFGVPGVTA